MLRLMGYMNGGLIMSVSLIVPQCPHRFLFFDPGHVGLAFSCPHGCGCTANGTDLLTLGHWDEGASTFRVGTQSQLSRQNGTSTFFFFGAFRALYCLSSSSIGKLTALGMVASASVTHGRSR
jgi:hypothetical protein